MGGAYSRDRACCVPDTARWKGSVTEQSHPVDNAASKVRMNFKSRDAKIKVLVKVKVKVIDDFNIFTKASKHKSGDIIKLHECFGLNVVTAKAVIIAFLF